MMMPEATDELRERLAKALHEAQCGCPTWVVKDLEDTQYDDMAAALLPLVAAVVAEARTEGAIAELEYLSADTAKTLQVWTPSDLNERAAALRGVGYEVQPDGSATFSAPLPRGVGNQKVGVTVDDQPRNGRCSNDYMAL